MQTLKILIVDDDNDLLTSYTAILKSENNEVVTASTAEEAVKLFTPKTFDIILLDLMMEESDSGLKLCSLFRAEDKTAEIYLLSAVGEQLATDIDIQTLGFNGVLEKPLKPDELKSLTKTGRKKHD